MNKKLMYAAMALPMLFTACSQDELFENTNGGMNTPEAKGFHVTMGPSLDIDSPETRAIWQASAGKLTWEPNEDLISVFWLGDQWGASALQGQFNSVFSTTDGTNFTSESMIYVGNNVSVYPADLAHVTSKAITLSVPAVQNAETILKTPYISNLLEVSEPKDNREEQEAGYHNKLVSPMKMAANVLVLNLHLDNIENLAQFGFAVKSVSLTADKNAFATTANLKQGGEVTNKEQGRVWEKTSQWSSVPVNTINKYLYASATASIPTLTATDITDKGNGDYEVKFVILPTHEGSLDLSAKSKIVVETNCGRLELTTTQKVGKVTAGIDVYPAADKIAEGTVFSGVVTDNDGNETAIAQLLESVSKHFTAVANANSTFRGEKIGVPYMRYVTGDMANATLNDSKVYSDAEILNYVAIHKAMNSTEPMNLILCDVVDEEGNGDGIFESLTSDVFDAIESRKENSVYKATMSLDAGVEKLLFEKNGSSAYMYFNNDGQWKNVGNNSLHVVLAASKSAWVLPYNYNYTKIGTIENPVGGSLTINGNNTYELNEAVLNNGTLNISGNKLLVGTKLTNNGTVNVAAAQDLVFNRNVESGINGTINVAKGAFMTVSAGVNVTSNATINNAGVVASNAGNGGLVNRGTINNLEGGYSYVQDNTYDAALDNKIVLTNRDDEVKVEKTQGKIVYNYNSAEDKDTKYFTRSIEDKFTYVVFGTGNDEIILEDEVIDDISMEFTSETTLKAVGQSIADLIIVENAHLKFPTPSTDYKNKLYVNDLTIKGDLTIGGIIYYSGYEEGKEKARSVGSGAIIFNAEGAISNLEAAIAKGGKVSLVANLTLTEALDVEGNVELNMNGNEIAGNINVADGADLTVENGTISNENSDVSGITSNGSLTLNNVTVESARHALRIESGDVTINGGTYKTNSTGLTVYALNVGDGGTVANVTINGGEFIGPKGTGADSGAAVGVKSGSTVTIYGGTFSNGLNSTLSGTGTIIIYGGKFDQDPSAYVADGYAATESNGWWTVSAGE